MSRYTLSINITSDNRDLLENLMVTLETVDGNLSEVDAVELFTAQAGRLVAKDEEPDRLTDPTILQRNLFLDRWCLSEAVG